MKKVLLIETLSQINGGQKMSLFVADMLQESGNYEVKWAIPGEGALSEKLKEKGYMYYLLGDLTMPSGIKGKTFILKYGFMSLCAMAKLNRIIRKERVDILYAPGPAALPWSAICGTLKHKPVIWHLHHNFTDGMTKKLINWCSKMKSVHTIIGVSDCVVNQIEKEKAKKITLYNPVNLSKYANGDADRVKTDIAEHLPLFEKTIKLLHVATLEKEKRQSVLIDMLRELKQRDIQASLLFVGSARQDNSSYVERIKKQAYDIGVADQVYFMDQRNDVEDILKNADIVLLPSIEGCSLAGLEACAAGVPLVGVEIAGAAEMIKKGDVGETFEFDNPISAADAIVRAYKPDRYSVIKENCVKFASKCSEKRYFDSIIEIFASCRTE